ncbi:unnamed protein product, partial [Polarella glacialis]
MFSDASSLGVACAGGLGVGLAVCLGCAAQLRRRRFRPRPTGLQKTSIVPLAAVLESGEVRVAVSAGPAELQGDDLVHQLTAPDQTVRWHVCCDLDGVLVDFDIGVMRAVGKNPEDIRAAGRREVSMMWRTLARTRGFFAALPWTWDGWALWSYLAAESLKGRISVSILSGVPGGEWADWQKRQWCTRQLGRCVPVDLCPSEEKALRAAPGKILIDDRLDQKVPWEARGGTFVLHSSAAESLKALRRIIK